MLSYTCSQCGPLPLDCFAPSAIKKAIHLCRACTAAKNKSYYASHPLVSPAAVCRRRDPCNLRAEDMQRVLAAFDNRCFITGSQEQHLTLIRADASLPLTPDNAVPVASRVARAMKHLPDAHLALWRDRGKMQT